MDPITEGRSVATTPTASARFAGLSTTPGERGDLRLGLPLNILEGRRSDVTKVGDGANRGFRSGLPADIMGKLEESLAVAGRVGGDLGVGEGLGPSRAMAAYEQLEAGLTGTGGRPSAAPPDAPDAPTGDPYDPSTPTGFTYDTVSRSMTDLPDAFTYSPSNIDLGLQGVEADPTGVAGGLGITIGKDGGQISFMGMKK
jgi:hypothetical protein